MSIPAPSREWLKRMADEEDKCVSVAAGCQDDVSPACLEKIGTHAIFWFMVWLVGGVVSYQVNIAASQDAYDAGDLSAFAWRAFWPYLVPIFLMHSAFFVAPLAVIAEIAFFIVGRLMTGGRR